MHMVILAGAYIHQRIALFLIRFSSWKHAASQFVAAGNRVPQFFFQARAYAIPAVFQFPSLTASPLHPRGGLSLYHSRRDDKCLETVSGISKLEISYVSGYWRRSLILPRKMDPNDHGLISAAVPPAGKPCLLYCHAHNNILSRNAAAIRHINRSNQNKYRRRMEVYMLSLWEIRRRYSFFFLLHSFRETWRSYLSVAQQSINGMTAGGILGYIRRIRYGLSIAFKSWIFNDDDRRQT